MKVMTMEDYKRERQAYEASELRDRFAMAALPQAASNLLGSVGTNRYEHILAERAYAIADAMLAQRNKSEG